MRLQSKRSLAAAAVLMATSSPAFAHHSFAMFDMTKCIRVTGTVQKFKFVYPHSWLWIEAAGAQGPKQIWAFETTDPASLAVRGWRPNTLKPGDKVTITFSPLLDGRAGGAMRAAVGPNGKPLSVEAPPCPK